MTLTHELVQAAVGSAGGAAVLFFGLLIGHAIADFPMQGTFLAMGKNRHVKIPDPEGAPYPRNLWVYCLTAHALVHAAPVWLLTGSVAFALVECVLHWLIDYSKNEKWTNFALDQGLHVACKAAYAIAIWRGFGVD
jgi:hypothetical protein